MRCALIVLVAACSSHEPRDLFATGGNHYVIPDDPTTALPFTGVALAATDLGEGFAAPECVIHDVRHDVYLVSNMNGAPHDKDDNGFISRVSPDGTMLQRKWIDGASPDVTLNAPRGMALDATKLYVVDVDSVQVFDRETGAQLATWPVPDAHFPNDVRVDADGNLLVTETGIHLSPEGPIPEGDSVVWKFDAAGTPTAIARGLELLGPNGIAATERGIVLVSFLGTDVYRLVDGHREPIATLPKGLLDGLVELDDGSFLVTSWEARGVYRVYPDGTAYLAIHSTAMVGPASIEYDFTREQAIVPNALANTLTIEPYPQNTAPAPRSPTAPM
jgi:sugar lactone lactonase YvrE